MYSLSLMFPTGTGLHDSTLSAMCSYTGKNYFTKTKQKKEPDVIRNIYFNPTPALGLLSAFSISISEGIFFFPILC